MNGLSKLVSLEKRDVIGLLCYRRDGHLSAYCKTFHPNWCDKTVTDVIKYRKGLLQKVECDEAQRAALVDQTPTPIQSLVNMWLRVFNDPTWKGVYNDGLPI